ncbi:MAG: bL28 family ribosomal protein [Patescibacteria group bacterium]
MSYMLKIPRVAEMGNRVSHAKNRTRHAFKRNLHTATLVIDGVKKRVKVPTKMLRVLKEQGLTTHFKKAE